MRRTPTVDTKTPIEAVSDALRSAGLPHRASGYGVLWPADDARLREIAAHLRTRRRPLWRLAAAVDALAHGLRWARRWHSIADLEIADIHYRRAIAYVRGDYAAHIPAAWELPRP